MRVEGWDAERFDELFEKVALKRIVEAAEVVKQAAKSRAAKGTITRDVYQSGPYAGQPWTARNPGTLRDSTRVVRLKTKSGKAFSKKRNVRVYAGHYLAWYARIVEFSKPFLRPALWNSISKMKQIMGADG